MTSEAMRRAGVEEDRAASDFWQVRDEVAAQPK